ncbi:HAD-IA family hydrolase [Bifidobacterium avesanii]|uniref:HAD-IA family hydrolase n=1 Tax=Bifidobacterium avesanii TaxID=1798157 RepID=A0A7K3TII0_9BIFI|nr:HAD-IA family hydrolase [Bifidobacterium avesanii]KAB8294561.1 hydrolase [Bifidobacterium avesanii]NEG78073.1 HAD-IA family hydrolase [Bifidobacterium avesanii]
MTDNAPVSAVFAAAAHAPAPAYTDVIFDFCDVLLDWRPRIPLEGQYPPGVIDMFFDRADEYGFWHYDELSDLGWSEEKILADYEAHHGPAVAWVFRVYFERQRMALAGMIPCMETLLHDLDAAGVRCWGLTNFTVKYVDAAREAFPALGLLRDVVVSSAERIHKPDTEIYRRAIDRFGVDPATTAFVDDKARNADAAGTVGLTGIQFTGADALRGRLFR